MSNLIMDAYALSKFLQLVKGDMFRALDVPKTWNDPYRAALSDNLVTVGFGGRLKLTAAGREALAAKQS